MLRGNNIKCSAVSQVVRNQCHNRSLSSSFVLLIGLSATCTSATVANVCRNLGMSDSAPRLVGDRLNEETIFGPGYVQPVLSPIPSNLTITASTDYNRDEALLALLTRAPFNELTGGILVYCASRDQTERLASFVRTSLQSVVNKVIIIGGLPPVRYLKFSPWSSCVLQFFH